MIETLEELENTLSYLQASGFISTAIAKGDKKTAVPFSPLKCFGKIALNALELHAHSNGPAVQEIGGCLFAFLPFRDSHLIIGPHPNRGIDAEMVVGLSEQLKLAKGEEEEVGNYLRSLPHSSLNRFLSSLGLLRYLLTGEKGNVVDYFSAHMKKVEQQIGEQYGEQIRQEENLTHATYGLEKRLLHYVQNGDVEGLEGLIKQIAVSAPIPEGKVASDALRQSKNIFIAFVAIIGKVGAIEGGLDIEETYRLIDIYTQECERCRNVDAVNKLRYSALLDFANRVQQKRRPHAYSPDVESAIHYIKSHLNEPLSVDDVLEAVQRSRSAFMTKFKAETQTTIWNYIVQCRLEEAKTLLSYTDMPLVEIASTFYFSSQSHFQNLFRNRYGETPLKYRNKTRKE